MANLQCPRPKPDPSHGDPLAYHLGADLNDGNIIVKLPEGVLDEEGYIINEALLNSISAADAVLVDW